MSPHPLFLSPRAQTHVLPYLRAATEAWRLAVLRGVNNTTANTKEIVCLNHCAIILYYFQPLLLSPSLFTSYSILTFETHFIDMEHNAVFYLGIQEQYGFFVLFLNAQCLEQNADQLCTYNRFVYCHTQFSVVQSNNF